MRRSCTRLVFSDKEKAAVCAKPIVLSPDVRHKPISNASTILGIAREVAPQRSFLVNEAMEQHWPEPSECW